MAAVYALKVGDRSKIGGEPFWRNDFIHAWCITGEAGTEREKKYYAHSTYWIAIYDEDAPYDAGRFECHLSAFGDMCAYNITGFYIPEEIENENDLLVQEMFLEKINWLLDTGILKMEDK